MSGQGHATRRGGQVLNASSAVASIVRNSTDAGGSQIGFRPLKRRVAQLAIAELGDDRLQTVGAGET